MTRFFLLFALLLSPLWIGCSSDPALPGEDAHSETDAHAGDDHADDDHSGDAGDEITLTPDQAQATAIETAVVASERLASGLSAPARIVPTETGQAVVGALVSGRIARLLAAQGDAVAKGAALAVVESPVVARLEGDYVQALAEQRRADQQLERRRVLASEGLVAGSLLEQSVADAAVAGAQVAALAGEIRAHGGSPPASASGVAGTVRVTSPIAGVVSQRMAQLGAFVSESTPLFEVVAPGQVYADADVAPDVAQRIGQGMTATIEDGGGGRYDGVVSFVGANVTGETRTAQVRVRLLRSAPDLRPQTFVTVRFDVPASDADAPAVLVVPASAIDREGERAFVYVPVGGEARTYARREVALGEATAERVAVASGLSAGDRVVTQGVFALKSFRSRGELTEHDH